MSTADLIWDNGLFIPSEKQFFPETDERCNFFNVIYFFMLFL